MKTPVSKTPKAAPAAAESIKPRWGDNSPVVETLAQYARTARAPGAAGVKGLERLAEFALSLLASLAEKGDAVAADALLARLECSLHGFIAICQARPEMFEPLASVRARWPAFIARHADDRKANEALADRLRLGSACGVNVTGKTWTRETTETAVALELFASLDSLRKDWPKRKARMAQYKADVEAMNKRLGRPADYRPPPPSATYTPEQEAESANWAKADKLTRTLAPLTRQNYKEWFAAAVPMLAARCGNDFENRKPFAAYWHPEHPAYKGESDRSRRALIRRDIKAKLKQAFRSIAPRA
jgi:hypothetical protein